LTEKGGESDFHSL